MESLEGKVAVVTGAASGMGRAFAERFVRAGMRVVLADVEEQPLEATVMDLGDDGGDVVGVVTDVSELASVEALRDAALEAYGQVNVLCNNAGVGGSVVAGERWVDEAEWRWVLGVNLWGVVHGHAAFLDHLVAHGDGHVVNTASMAGLLGGHTAYTASKFAVVGITEGLAQLLAARRSTVGVSCLCPGFVSTNIMASHRNRPSWAAPPMTGPAPSAGERSRYEAMAGRVRGGKDPAEVAELVHDAVLSGRFWVFTDDDWMPNVAARNRALEAGENSPNWRLASPRD
ncbi:MAG: SDR family NAD(P)-dependent oxidoreductase [Acidimicrobiia bacterium]|nr:SDR family NAD(P)-dependent oxidoreductase [Acidimicrobiia bacterium]